MCYASCQITTHSSNRVLINMHRGLRNRFFILATLLLSAPRVDIQDVIDLLKKASNCRVYTQYFLLIKCPFLLAGGPPACPTSAQTRRRHAFITLNNAHHITQCREDLLLTPIMQCKLGATKCQLTPLGGGARLVTMQPSDNCICKPT
jgi:hypothetical protein